MLFFVFYLLFLDSWINNLYSAGDKWFIFFKGILERFLYFVLNFWERDELSSCEAISSSFFLSYLGGDNPLEFKWDYERGRLVIYLF